MDEDLKKLSPIVEAIRRMVHDHATYQKSLAEVDDQFTKLLTEESARQAQPIVGMTDRVRHMGQSVLRSVHTPKTKKHLLERIKQVCELTDREVRLIWAIGLITADEMGKPILKNEADVMLTHEKAAMYLFAIGCLLGMALWSILMEPTPGIWLALRGFGLGWGIGSIAGFVLGRSFRAYPVLEKLKKLDPWLGADSVGRSCA